MATIILATKLYVPAPRPNVVLRPRLTERLNDGLRRKLTLLSAPAGFGKTTLVSDWAKGSKRPTAWLSLDEGDSDLVRFLIYIVAALQTITPQWGEGLLAMLQSPQPPPTESLLTALLNDIAGLPEPFILVLDDYHVIDAPQVDTALTFLLEHLPPAMHLVITTRADPSLPLGKLRARDQLTELRARDLRFTPAEAAAFLNQVMGLSLSAADVAALEERTEGWIAGLQLAALSMQGRADVPGFIRAFAGDHRYIADYLVEEVLRRQPPPVRDFLLQTAILDRLNGPLCEAVTGQTGGSAQLEALERGNFFVVPLDDQRQWYRYHHLFAEVLHAHLLAEQPGLVSTLHGRASEWYERHGSSSDAIRHALAARDFERAADLVERAIPAMRSSRQEAMMLAWLKAFPDELLAYRPVLSLHYAGALMQNSEFSGIEARLRDAERWLDTPASSGEQPASPSGEPGRRMVVVDEAEFRVLPASIAMYRAGIALAQGDMPETMRHARRVNDLTAADDHFRRGAAAGLLALAYWTNGALAAAHESYSECMAQLLQAGYIADIFGCAVALADIRMVQGRLHDAMRTYERALQVAMPPGVPVLRGAADMYVGQSALHLERNDLAAARQHLQRSQAMGEHMGFPQNRYRERVAMARIQEAEGDLDGALDLLAEAERLYVADFFPNVRPLAASKARLRVAQGRLDEALDWARAQKLSSAGDLAYLHEFEHITLARVLLAQHRRDPAGRSLPEAIALLERLLQAAEAGERMGSVIEILILQALAHQLHGGLPAALAPLERALTLAEPEGYVRIFVAEGQPMQLLIVDLKLMMDKGLAGASQDTQRLLTYIKRLLNAFPQSPAPSTIKNQPLTMIEPLTERERETLRLLATDLSGPEIARRLTLSLHTVRTHTKNIYSKLGVNNRREAIRRAEELNLL